MSASPYRTGELCAIKSRGGTAWGGRPGDLTAATRPDPGRLDLVREAVVAARRRAGCSSGAVRPRVAGFGAPWADGKPSSGAYYDPRSR